MARINLMSNIVHIIKNIENWDKNDTNLQWMEQIGLIHQDVIY